MPDDTTSMTETNEKASDLRAIFEILSYIHVDAKNGGFRELYERIGFSMDCAEYLINGGKAKSQPTEQAHTEPSHTASPEQNGPPQTVL